MSFFQQLRSKLQEQPASRVRFFLLLLLSSAVHAFVQRSVDRVAGGLGAPLDDVFIHFQYARSIAEFHPFRYAGASAAPSSGATSVLYPIVLAVPYLLGFKGLSLLYPARLLAVLGTTLTAEGLYRLFLRAWGPVVAWPCALLAVLSPGLLWAGASCMETIFAVAMVCWCYFLSLEHDLHPSNRTGKSLAVLGTIAPFVRPELVSLSLLSCVVLLLRSERRRKLFALFPLASVFALPLFWKVLTGSSRTTGTMAKWVLFEPYASRAEVLTQVKSRANVIVMEHLAGHGYAARFVPEELNKFALLGWLLLVFRSLWLRRWVSALVWLSAPLLLLPPATFGFFDVHRFRYLWPSYVLPMGAALVACVFLGALIARIAALLFGGAFKKTNIPSLLACGAMLALHAQRVPVQIDDLGDCARAIRRQHFVMIDQYLRQLPAGTPLLIYDAGVLAYLTQLHTVDAVGLTTWGLAEAHRNGGGSTFEALERLPPAQRPSHAAVYRYYLGLDELFGATLGSVTWEQHSILGASTKEFIAVRRNLFGTGALPLDRLSGRERVVDEVDVADVESERAHQFVVARAERGHNLLRVYVVEGRGEVADGGRVVRTSESFVLRGQPGRAARWLLRTDAWHNIKLEVRWNGVLLSQDYSIERSQRFVDVSFGIPATMVRAENTVLVRLREGQDYGSFHHFLLQ